MNQHALIAMRLWKGERRMNRYKCPICFWIGTEDEMEADSFGEPSDEVWSNWICHKCGAWHQLNDYVIIPNEAIHGPK